MLNDSRLFCFSNLSYSVLFYLPTTFSTRAPNYLRDGFSYSALRSPRSNRERFLSLDYQFHIHRGSGFLTQTGDSGSRSGIFPFPIASTARARAHRTISPSNPNRRAAPTPVPPLHSPSAASELRLSAQGSVPN